MRSIEITFTATGETKIEAIGFKGKGCQQATADFEKALGAVESDSKKPEYFQKADTTLKQTV
jgi:hypothetical protein